MNNRQFVMKREDYKKVKSMNRLQLTVYLSRIWQRGYEAGLKGIVKSSKSQQQEAVEEKE